MEILFQERKIFEDVYNNVLASSNIDSSGEFLFSLAVLGGFSSSKVSQLIGRYYWQTLGRFKCLVFL